MEKYTNIGELYKHLDELKVKQKENIQKYKLLVGGDGRLAFTDIGVYASVRDGHCTIHYPKFSRT